MSEDDRPRMVGLNHVALEVRDLDEELEFLGALFEVRLRSRGERKAFVDLGDQFIALAEGREGGADGERHLGLAVDDKDQVRRRLEEMGVEIVSEHSLMFRDPSGNLFQVVGYEEIQFTKAPWVLAGMGLDHLRKSDDALAELADKGLAPE